MTIRIDWRTAEKRAIRDGVSTGLAAIGSDKRVVVLSGDLAESTRINGFEEAYPDRFFEMGVAEQNMMGVAAGLASEGFVPYVSSYAVFSPGRNWEQVRVSVAISKLNVKILGGHGGLATGQNGPTHQAGEDVAIMRALPKMVVLVPADAEQAKQAIIASYKYVGPVYIRLARPQTPNFTKDLPFEIGKAEVYRPVDPQVGKVRVSIFAMGIMVYTALLVAQDLASEGIECEVVNVSSVKPMDRQTIVMSAKKTGKVVTMEDHQTAGGLGGAVAEVLSEECPTRMEIIGIEDRFGGSGSFDELYRDFGLDTDSVKARIRKFVLD